VVHLIAVFPFLAFVINILFGRRLRGASAWISIAASIGSFLLSVAAFQGLRSGQGSYNLGTWLTIHGVPLNFGVLVDPLSVMMLLVVTIVATLIKIYSVGYMRGDSRYSRYFAYISLFTASMLGLILSDNFVMLYIFWEGVGLCSYLLIAFWFERPAAARAGLKAFLTTRIGDTGFLIGIFLLFFATKNLHFDHLGAAIASAGPQEGLLIAAAILIFLGAIGKSAQFPLHVWLPDAMEGPTAVSALIHAATMVAAGVYLVARCYVLFMAYPVCLQVVAVIGAISALMAASIATVNNDIKRILAYSTISQLGLMMLGLGVGGYTAGTFHLMTHAFFKALLFLCAGSVIHALHTQDIRKMGGLLPHMKVTGWTLIIGMLAIAGVPPFSGFWSKDEILVQAWSGHPVLFGCAVLTSLLTAFYMSRLVFLVLFGKPRSEFHAHESPRTMSIPLMILAVLAVFSGFLGSPFLHHAFQKFIFFSPEHGGEGGEAHPLNYSIMLLSALISLAGIGLAYVLYIRQNKILPEGLRRMFTPLYKLLLNKYYIDEIYEAVIVKPCLAVCRWLSGFDCFVIDGLVNAAARFFQFLSLAVRPVQTGLIQNYVLIQVMGVVVLIVVLFFGIAGFSRVG